MAGLRHVLLIGCALVLIQTTASADNSTSNQTSSEINNLRVANYKQLDPALATTNPTNYLYCPASGVVAFSVSGQGHISEGANTLLGYSTTYTNEGGGWIPGGGSFVAPCRGLYVFSVSFVRDPAYGGTSNDVRVFVTKNGASQGYAWAGSTSTAQRTTGTYEVALILNQGDYVQTFVNSDGGYKRYLGLYNLTGFLVRQF